MLKKLSTTHIGKSLYRLTVKNFTSGFTLMELLIVIAILGTLATVFVTTFPASQKKARDANRKSDIKQYQTSLETFANKNNGLYPSSAGAVVTADTALCGYLGYASGECSKDSKDGQLICSGLTCRYFYISNNCGAAGLGCATQYVLFGALENPSANTKKYFVVCSNGKTAEGLTTAPTNSNCPV